MMTREARHTETLLREVLFSALDACSSARASGSPTLVYLADMMVQCARAELYALRGKRVADRTNDAALEDDHGSP